MVYIKINGEELIVDNSLSVLQAAEQAGYQIPALCHNNDLEHFTSCMICLVKEQKSDKLIPCCSVKVEEGMEIITDDEEIHEARKTALELLLSEHVGDCEAPCQIACPAHMDIPLMNRLLADGEIDNALEVVKKDIILPSVLGRICPAPCEGACRRKSIDNPVSICLLKRFAGDAGNSSVPGKPKPINKKIAIIGAGPAGLSAAYYLHQKGFQPIVFDKNTKPGGALQYAIPDEQLDKKILDQEINFIKDTGITFNQNTQVTNNMFLKLIKEYDAVVVATGDLSEEISAWGLNNNSKQILVDKKTYRTNLSNVFAIGNVNRSTKYAIRSLGQGKEVAYSIEQLLTDKEITGGPRLFNSRFGKLAQEEYTEYLKESTNEKRVIPSRNDTDGFILEEVKKEAARCLHCDCRKPTACKLRIYSNQYGAIQNRFNYEGRKFVKKFTQHDIVIYEPEKCIKCGICVRMTEKYKEKFGFTFIGRGFDVKIGAPFNEQLNNSLTSTAKIVAEACPTGALSLK